MVVVAPRPARTGSRAPPHLYLERLGYDLEADVRQQVGRGTAGMGGGLKKECTTTVGVP